VVTLLPNEPAIARSVTSIVIAAILAAAGIALAVTAAITFRRHETTVDPFGKPEHLVKSGPFALTRNPMYVGVTLVLLGYGVFNGQAAFLAVPFAFVYTVSKFYIPREEKLLGELFPGEFEKYKEEVRRWI
jgi:protein-S-isoprenylcysteine O-methyltransferase Ste14